MSLSAENILEGLETLAFQRDCHLLAEDFLGWLHNMTRSDVRASLDLLFSQDNK